MCFVVLLAYSFIVFVLSSPLRPLSRVASDYFSDSVVCIEILRPLRPLREIKITSVCFHAKSAKSAEIYSLSYFTLALEWSQTSLRQECAESLSTPSPPAGVLAPVSGGETDPSPALPCMGGSSYNRLVPHQQNIILPSIQGGAGGRVLGLVRSPKTFTSLCTQCWARKSSYRQGSVLA